MAVGPYVEGGLKAGEPDAFLLPLVVIRVALAHDIDLQLQRPQCAGPDTATPAANEDPTPELVQ
jgi:hypothetical protein